MQAIHEAGKFAEFRKNLGKPSPRQETPSSQISHLLSQRKFDDAAREAKKHIDGGALPEFFRPLNPADRSASEITLALNVHRSKKIGPFVEITNITPAVAAVILANNPRNRKIVTRGLSIRLHDVLDESWELTGETIIVSNTGELNDGQHRLWAVFLTGKCISAPIFYGAERDTRVHIDTGTARTDASAFDLGGIKNYAIISATISKIALADGRETLTRKEKFAFYYENETRLQEVPKHGNTLPRGASKSNFCAAAFILLREGACPDAVSEFFSEVRGQRVFASKTSSSKKLRELLLARAFKGRDMEQILTVIEYYNYWRRGAKIHNQTITEMPIVETR